MGDAAVPFDVRLTLPDGKTRKVQCDQTTDVAAILQAVSAKLGASGAADFALAAPGRGPEPLPTDALANMDYVRECRQRGKRCVHCPHLHQLGRHAAW